MRFVGRQDTNRVNNMQQVVEGSYVARRSGGRNLSAPLADGLRHGIADVNFPLDESPPPPSSCAAGVGARTGVRPGHTGAARAQCRRCRAISSGDDRSSRRCRAISSGDHGSSRQCRAISSGDAGSCRRCRAISSGDDGSSRRTARSGAAAAARGVRAVTRHHAGHSGAGSPSPH